MRGALSGFQAYHWPWLLLLVRMLKGARTTRPLSPQGNTRKIARIEALQTLALAQHNNIHAKRNSDKTSPCAREVVHTYAGLLTRVQRLAQSCFKSYSVPCAFHVLQVIRLH